MGCHARYFINCAASKVVDPSASLPTGFSVHCSFLTVSSGRLAESQWVCNGRVTLTWSVLRSRVDVVDVVIDGRVSLYNL